MKIDTIRENEWKEYFNKISDSVCDNSINIEILGYDIGLRVLVENDILKDFRYDPKEKTLKISTKSLTHIVNYPEQVYVTMVSDRVDSMEIIDAKEHHQIIKLLTPLNLN